MIDAVRVSVEDVRARLRSPAPPLLVLAYEDERKFRSFGAPEAIPLSALRARLPELSRDQEIVLYCA